MSKARCRILAHPAGHGIYRCPSGMRTFHYHAINPNSPVLILATMQRICEHRHRESAAALKCFEKGN